MEQPSGTRKSKTEEEFSKNRTGSIYLHHLTTAGSWAKKKLPRGGNSKEGSALYLTLDIR